MGDTHDVWPAGATWVFQGTVLEDATAGTHVCTLTVTPGAGNELQLLYGRIDVGATATAQTASVRIDDGTNSLTHIMNPGVNSGTTASEAYVFPQASTGNTAALLATNIDFSAVFNFLISGTMRLILQVATAAVSVTQTFAVVCRIKGALPTATLADSVGVPVLTTNTNAVF